MYISREKHLKINKKGVKCLNLERLDRNKKIT